MVPLDLCELGGVETLFMASKVSGESVRTGGVPSLTPLASRMSISLAYSFQICFFRKKSHVEEVAQPPA